MIVVKILPLCEQWIANLRDIRAKAAIYRQIARATEGNFGDSKFIKDGLREMRIHYGPGFRPYYTQLGDVIYIILHGGIKATQNADIEYAKQIMEREIGFK